MCIYSPFPVLSRPCSPSLPVGLLCQEIVLVHDIITVLLHMQKQIFFILIICRRGLCLWLWKSTETMLEVN